MLIPAFHLHLSEKIQRGQATIGKYDGKNPCLTAATTAGKIFIHNPHADGQSEGQISYLNVNKQIAAVVAGRLVPRGTKEVLLVGTPSNLQCYDVDQNRDLFFKDIPDGVNCVIVGQLGFNEKPLAIVGGNCSVQGFTEDGSESFWTVTGDNVAAMAFCDVDMDGKNELLVGSDDFDIRIFQGEEVIGEATEADQFVALCAVYGPKFGYALVNGTIGVYEKLDRVWRVKSKHSVCGINSFDLDGDGVPELISGWSNGRMEVRRAESGEVVYRDHLSCPVASIVRADYRNDGTEQIIVCGVEGEIRGYVPYDGVAAPAPEQDFGDQQAIMAELAQRKQELLYELSSYKASTDSNTNKATVDPGAVIPPNTRVDSYIAINREQATCDLVLKSNNDSLIRGVVVFGEQIFEEESLFVYPQNPQTEVSVPLKPLKDVSVVLMIKVLVGARSSSTFHVFELEIELPRFSMYAAVDKSAYKEPEGAVTFIINERMTRISAWIESRFNVKASVEKADMLDAFFISLRDGNALGIKAVPINHTTQVTIKSDSMDLAGDMLQDLATFLGVPDLGSTAEFPTQMAAFKDVLQRVDEHNLTRLKMNADMADSSNLIKALLIKGEDARILGDIAAMKRYYKQLYDLNKDMIAEHERRATNHAKLLDALKDVNQMIQRAAKLRVGAAKSKVVTLCRTAIKNNNMTALFKIVRDGDGPV